eukprot:11847371-Alexandrium_andersonii.AAC.1
MPPAHPPASGGGPRASTRVSWQSAPSPRPPKSGDRAPSHRPRRLTQRTDCWQPPYREHRPQPC